MIEALAPVLTRALTDLVLGCLFFLPVESCAFVNKIKLKFLCFDFF
jgi:hypothetical protein